MIKRTFKYTMIAILGIALAVGLTAVLQVTRMEGSGMEPTVDKGDILVINKTAYIGKAPECGDLIAFAAKVYSEEDPGNIFVKRVVASEGDLVEERRDGVYVNGKSVLSGEGNTSSMKNQVVGKGKVFVLGDNAGTGMDSRDRAIGQVALTKIIGKVCLHLGK